MGKVLLSLLSQSILEHLDPSHQVGLEILISAPFAFEKRYSRLVFAKLACNIDNQASTSCHVPSSRRALSPIHCVHAHIGAILSEESAEPGLD